VEFFIRNGRLHITMSGRSFNKATGVPVATGTISREMDLAEAETLAKDFAHTVKTLKDLGSE
jgi:hypothetical protein